MMKSPVITKNQGRGTPRSNINCKVCENPAAKNMPHEEEYDDNNYELIDETAV